LRLIRKGAEQVGAARANILSATLNTEVSVAKHASSDPGNERQVSRKTVGRIRGMMTDVAGQPSAAVARKKGQQLGDDALAARQRPR
jgi:hypothetical protein